MTVDCHVHMVLDGENWKQAIHRHSEAPDDKKIREALETYQKMGFTYLRDGGDRWGVGLRVKQLAGEYGITYVTPLAPLYKAGHYGAFIGEKYHNFHQFHNLVKKTKRNGGDFIKVMISGIMDFNHFGVLSEPGYSAEDIREIVSIAHGEGMAVMAHANGNDVVLAAAEAGVDSVEHGAYLREDALAAMKEMGTVWVPTLSAVGNIRHTGRYDETAVEQILECAQSNVAKFAHMGGLLAPGTDAGAWSVYHGTNTEFALLEEALGANWEQRMQPGIDKIMATFRPAEKESYQAAV